LKEIKEICKAALPEDTRYDRFYLDEALKIFKVQKELDQLVATLNSTPKAEFLDVLLVQVKDQSAAKAKLEAEKLQKQKEEEAKQN